MGTTIDHARMFLDEAAALEREFRGFSIKPKRASVLCKFLNAILWVLTLGKTEFMTGYHTTLGKTIYVSPQWDSASWLNRWILLRHEGIHLKQAKRMGLGLFWFGWLIFSFAYLFLLPFGLTLRSRWEREAYTETIRCSQRFGVPVSRSDLFKNFTGAQYFWMDLRKSRVSAWLDLLGVTG